MLPQSVRVAVFAHALSSWVEGTSQLRAYLLSPPQLPLDSAPMAVDDADGTLLARFTRWLTAPGAQLNDNDGMLMGVVQMASALALFKAARVQPLMPLLLTPLLAAAAVPIPHAALLVSRGLRPVPLIATVLLFAVLHETERAGVSTASRITHERQKELSGSVLLCGASASALVDQDDDDDDERECIICSAPAATGSQPPRSLSSESLASLASTNSRAAPALGPLEAFCTTAPQKHLAHRECFLAWQAAYAQSHLPPPVVVIAPPKPAAPSHFAQLFDEDPLTRARALLGAAAPAVAHLAAHLVPTGTGATLALDASGRGATLTSPHPPCPLCRSSTVVALRAVAPANVVPVSLQRVVRTFVREWARLVSPRTVGARALGQGAFLWALLSVMRVREGVRERVRQRAVSKAQ